MINLFHKYHPQIERFHTTTIDLSNAVFAVELCVIVFCFRLVMFFICCFIRKSSEKFIFSFHLLETTQLINELRKP